MFGRIVKPRTEDHAAQVADYVHTAQALDGDVAAYVTALEHLVVHAARILAQEVTTVNENHDLGEQLHEAASVLTFSRPALADLYRAADLP